MLLDTTTKRKLHLPASLRACSVSTEPSDVRALNPMGPEMHRQRQREREIQDSKSCSSVDETILETSAGLSATGWE
ncbi:hypothetical protein Mapa_006642 [Marchantia paleacea]|nr:hypothetical protein Mapa_006642 [Marchantia paleacea]